MLFDTIAVALAVVFVALGAFRGTLAGFLRVATLASAYLVSYLAATNLAKVAALLTGMSKLGAGVALGCGVFALVYLAGTIVSALLIRVERDRRADRPRSGYDRFGGACFGAFQACLSLLMLAVLGSVLDAAYRVGLPAGMDQSHSFLVASTRRVVAKGLGATLGDGPGAKLAVKLVSDPGETLRSTQQLLAGPRFSGLQNDSMFWELLTAGQVDAAMGRASFFQLMHDEPTRQAMADLGLVPEEARSDPNAFRSALRGTLVAAAPRIRAIRNDPAISELASDPEVQQALDEGNAVGLLSHPQMRELLDRAMRDYEAAEAAAPAAR